MAREVVGVIGGSGLYEMEGMTGVSQLTVDTPFGPPSDAYVTGTLDGVDMVFLPRHGKGHRFTPSEVNYRANIYGMKKLGVTRIISVSAVGSLKEEIVPGHIVIADQFIDRTRGFRKDSFFGNGVVGHVQFADPVCSELSATLFAAAGEVGATVHRGGCYVCMEGPAFSTRAESHLYRSMGASIIGMTNLTEAKLAREAEICYGVIALCTDYDCWHGTHADVSVEAIIAIINANVATAKLIIKASVERVALGRGCGCGEALRHALISDISLMPVETRENLALIVGRYL